MENVLSLDIEQITAKIQKQKDHLKYQNIAILNAA